MNRPDDLGLDQLALARALAPGELLAKLNATTDLLYRIVGEGELTDELYDEALGWLEAEGLAPTYQLTAKGALLAQRLDTLRRLSALEAPGV